MKKIIVCIMMCYGASLYGQNTLPGDTMWGIQGGYTNIAGQYSNSLDNSFWFGLYFTPRIYRLFMIENNIAYTRFQLSESNSSHLEIATLGLGAFFHYPIRSFMDIYAGPAFEFSYLYLKATETEKEINSFKPGFSAQSGLLFSITKGLQVRAGISYSHKWISNISFMNINYNLGVSFNYKSFVRSIEPDFVSKPSAEDIKNKYFSLGIQHFNNGRMEKALLNFKEVLKIEKNHAQARHYIDIIEKNLALFKTAMAHKKKGELYLAIPYLIKAEEHMPEAHNELLLVRSELQKIIPLLEKQGIDAYNKRDYKSCIEIMNRLQLIDPNNETVLLYLPRAQKRYNALSKFR